VTFQRLRTLLPLALVALAVLGTVVAMLRGGPGGGPASHRPNIVFILTDDLDIDLGSLEYMPAVRRLIGAQGTTFSHFYVPVSLCCPSRSTILLGQFVHNHQVYGNDPPAGGFFKFQELHHDRGTIATALRAAGYRTALLGKYLNGYPDPSNRAYVPPGWDEWAVPSDDNAYAGTNYELNVDGRLERHGERPEDYLTDVLAGRAVDFVRWSREPFFLYLAPYGPHKPAIPAPRHAALFAGLRAPRTPAWDEADVSDKPSPYRDAPPLTPENVDYLDRLYRRRIQTLQSVDEMVSRVVAALAESGRLDDTYVIFTSDNGFHMGQHRLLASKYTAFEEDVHVPFLLRGPRVPVGRTVDALAETVDLAPTFAEIADARLPLAPDGRSLTPLWGPSPPAAWRESVLIEQREIPAAAAGPEEGESGTAPPRLGRRGVLEPPEPPAVAGAKPNPAYVGLRTQRYKYVEYTDGERELYDLARDPHELDNLAGREAQADPALLARLAAVLARLRTCAGASCRAADSIPVRSGLVAK
jgi:N-acetylglucosamine-6-sulfatase